MRRAAVSFRKPRAGGRWGRSFAYLTLSPTSADFFSGLEGREGPGVLRARVADPSLSVVQRGFPVRQGWDVGWSWLPTWTWSRLAARLWGNRPSPVRKVWGLAVWASRMMPNPSS